MGKMKGGRRKGAPFENEIASDLSEWFSWSESRDWFRRTEASGGRSTARPKTDPLYWEYGDITFRHLEGQPLIERLLIECKRGHKEHIKFVDLIDSWNNPRVKNRWILDWWNKAWEETEAAERNFPVIIFKRDFMDKCIIVSRLMIVQLEVFCGVWGEECLEFRFKEEEEKRDFMVVRFFDFLNWCSPEDLVEGIPIKNSIQYHK